MRYKYIFLTVCYLLFSVMLLGKNKAIITLHLSNLPKNINSSVYISMDSSVYYVDSVGLPVAVIKLDVDNPFPVMIIANNVLPSNKVFWVHEGAYEVFYDMKTYSIRFGNSPLNEEFVRTKGIRDSINYLAKENQMILWQNMDDVYRKKDTTAKVKLDVTYKFYKDNEKQINQLDSTATEALYQYYIQHPTSFLALDFINNNLDLATIKKDRLQVLFSKLDAQVKKYPLYVSCKERLNKLPDNSVKPKVKLTISEAE